MDPIQSAKKSKKTVTIILVVTALLAIASVIAGYYYLQITDLAPTDSKASQGCACYYVSSTSTVTNCSQANPQMAYQFQTGTTQSDNSCSASCDLREPAPLVVANDTILRCKVADFTINPGCVDISIEDSSEKRYANSIPQNAQLTLKATFKNPSNLSSTESDFYESFTFLVNGEKTDVQVAQATSTGSGVDKTYVVTTQITDLKTADALSVQAIGNSTSGAQLTSDACNRSLTVAKTNAPTCTELKAEITNTTSPKVNEIALTTSSITNPSTVSVKFKVGDSNNTYTTKNIANKLTNGSIILNSDFLNSANNFTDSKISLGNITSNDVKIAATMYVDGKEINSENCLGEFEIPQSTTEPRDPSDGGENPTDPTDPNDDDPSDPTDGTPPADTTTSNFSTQKAANVACLERAAPRNAVTYTITVNNNDSDTENIVRVEDKLPLGFTYVSGSTLINGVAQSDSGLVETTTVGNTIQITFEKTGGWNVAPSNQLVIKFNARASSTSLTGANLNEVVVVPQNTPTDADTLRASVSTQVAQTCTAPETALFDSTASKIMLSIIIIFMGTYFYFSQSGLNISEKLLGSGVAKGVRKLQLKANDPKRYFEEKMVEEMERRPRKK